MGQLICAWCQKVLNTNYPVEGISHGICHACEAKLREQMTKIKQEKGKICGGLE